MITNTGNSKFPWIIQAKINSSSNPNVTLIFEIEVPVVNGYANFTKLGISNLVDNLEDYDDILEVSSSFSAMSFYDNKKKWKKDRSLFDRWCTGETGKVFF